MYKTIICDLDGTLLNSQHTISAYTHDIIQKVKAEGVKVFIATGRHHRDTFIFKHMLGLDSFLITSNGAKIHDENNREIFSHNIPANLSRQLIKMDIDSDIVQNIYQDDIWYCNNYPTMLKDFYKESGFSYEKKPFNEISSEVTKFFYICNANPEKLIDLEAEMITRFKGKLNITFSLPTCLEIMKRGVSKGTAVQEVLQHENIDPKDAIAIGDGLNDYEMLKVVGKGLLMGNCNYRIREALPNCEMIDTCDNDGVAKYLEKTFL
ncbi:MAG: Cof-type HAD-IIB family hydrolase [Prevotellaceae bacterium]|jgi:Cof subfamily protein (haloacid dehalogenase superfamily)|nr:Cof-type HAD-IIB family hydrolase [Prevotellaceae bacterium]